MKKIGYSLDELLGNTQEVELSKDVSLLRGKFPTKVPPEVKAALKKFERHLQKAMLCQNNYSEFPVYRVYGGMVFCKIIRSLKLLSEEDVTKILIDYSNLDMPFPKVFEKWMRKFIKK